MTGKYTKILSKRFYLLVFLFVISFSLSGCVDLEKLDQKVKETNQDLAQSAQENFQDDIDKAKADLKQKAKDKAYEVAEKSFLFVADSLTSEAKRRIDDWLAKNSFNEYGDPKDTNYTGGTPLFDESTGENKDKYEYVLEQHPELVEELGL